MRRRLRQPPYLRSNPQPRRQPRRPANRRPFRLHSPRLRRPPHNPPDKLDKKPRPPSSG